MDFKRSLTIYAILHVLMLVAIALSKLWNPWCVLALLPLPITALFIYLPWAHDLASIEHVIDISYEKPQCHFDNRDRVLGHVRAFHAITLFAFGCFFLEVAFAFRELQARLMFCVLFTVAIFGARHIWIAASKLRNPLVGK